MKYESYTLWSSPDHACEGLFLLQDLNFIKQLRTILITGSTMCSQRVVDLASSPSVEMKTKQLKITCAGHAHSDVMNRYKRGEQGPKTLL